MTVEESAHYPIHGLDAAEEWATSSPKGFGYIRLGDEHRAFAISMFHQFHCVRLMRSALDGDYRPVIQAHVEHCLNYIRQMILCSPDLTLEPPDVLTRDFEVERMGATHVCEDWRQVYEEMEKNWAEWTDIRVAFRNTTVFGYDSYDL